MRLRTRLDLGLALQVLGLLAMGALLFWSVVRPYPIHAQSRLFVLVFLGAVTLAIVFTKRARPDVLRLVSILMAGLLLGTLLSPAWRTSLESAFIPLVVLALLVFVSILGLTRRSLAMAVVGAGSMLAVVALSRFALETSFWIETIGQVAPASGLLERLPVTLPRVGAGGLHPNETALVAVLAIPMALVGRREFTEYRHFWAAALVALALMLLVTGSRGGLVSGVLAAVVTIWFLRRREPGARRRRYILGSMGGLVVLIAAAVLFFSDFRPQFIFRGTAADRLPVWSAAWDMFSDRPLVGNGSGSFSWLVDEYLGSTYPGVESRRIWNEPHNGYFQVLSEYGLVGAVAVAIGLVLFVSRVKALIARGGFDRQYAVAAIAALVGLSIHSIFDSVLAGLAPLTFLAVIVGGVYGDELSHPASRVWLPRLWALGLVVPVLAFAVVTIGSQFEYERGVAAAFESDWSRAADYFDGAAAGDPMPAYSRAAAVAWSMAGGDDEDLHRRAAGLEPFESAAFLNLVSLSDASTRGHLIDQEAHRLRSEEVIQIFTGELRASAGDDAGAMESYTSALLTNPWLSGAGVWIELLPGVEQRDQLIRRALEADPCGVGDVLYLEGVDITTFRSVIESACPPGHPTYLALQLARGERESAHATATEALTRVPEDMRLRRVAAQSSAETDREESRRHLAIGALLGDAWSSVRLAESYASSAAPDSVHMLLRRNSMGYSPVVGADEEHAIYRFGAIRSRIVDRRVEIPSTLLDGSWRAARTPIHLEIRAFPTSSAP